LLAEVLPDEEVVVVDGNSTDGSKEYLRQLFNEGKIQQFISEKDHNQAHAWNKAMLMANGELIKKIIDDDVFCYKAIRECKSYMLANPAVDVVISNDLGSPLHDHKNIQKFSRLSQFEKWSKGITPSFTFGDVHLLIRKKALAYIGLYNTAYVMMDWEYSLRISYLQANIAYYTGYNALSVAHAQTVSSQKNKKLIEEQGERGCIFYEYAGDAAEISNWSKLKIGIGKLVYKSPGKNAAPTVDAAAEDIEATYHFYYGHLEKLNASQDFRFIEKNS
jgi:glycosyltransferase involved in cell wall biosynthesis